jgi:hypothetical protein
MCSVEPQRVTNQKRVILVVGSLVAVVALVLGIIIATQDDDDPETTGSSSTTTTVAPSSTTTTAASTTSTTIDPDDLDLAAFPDLRSGDRYDDPVSLVRAFATEVLGFDTDLRLSELQQGDARSGEVVVSPATGSLETTVAVRQLADGAWVVVAANTPTIQLETPIARTRLASPQPLIGAASAFEGNVLVQLYADGSNAPIGATNVLGRGDGVLGDFEGEIEFDDPTGATHGVLVLTSDSGEDGAPIEAAVLRVLL